jgi:glucose/arabinose dehydrogenase
LRRYRRSPVSFLLAIILLGLVAGPTTAEPEPPAPSAPAASTALSGGQLRVTHVTSGLSSPVGLANAGDGSNRLFIVEQRGTVRVFSGNSLRSGFFLDIRGVAGGFSNGGERGLLSIAFHPDFETNRKLFAYYTDGGGDLIITELTANSAGTSVSASTADPIMEIEHSTFSNHNGGQLLFGPDENLYIFTGDGGSSGDPFESGQNTNSQLGKVLRITPNLSGGRSIPSDNPFVGGGGNAAVWDYGLRNPWRASFDRANGTLWIADVGQGSWEEINREPATSPGGVNYGWDRCEGAHLFEGPGPCTSGGLTGPVEEYANGNGNCAVTGGFVYRGGIFPDMVSQYVLGDYCSGRLWTLQSGAGSPSLQFHRDTSILITSFGESEKGELYLTDHRGALYRVVAPPYTDVADHSLIDHIMWITTEGISTGCGGGEFCPNSAVTRAQMAAFLDRALDLPGTSEDFFTDDDGHQLEISINRVAAAGIASGCATNRYCPSSPVTRGQMASFLDRAFDLPPTSNDYFVDDETSTHENAINRLAKANITGGCTAIRFCPNASTTRAEMATFLHRAIGD